MKNPFIPIVAVLAAAVTLTLTACSSPSYPPGHPWWTGEPVYKDDKLLGYFPEDTDGDERLVGQGDGEPPGCRGRVAPAEPDGTCPAGGPSQLGQTGGQRYRPLTPSAAAAMPH